MSLELISLAVNALLIIGMGLLSRVDRRQEIGQQELKERLGKNDETTRDHENRLTTLEETIRHLPTAESVGRLHQEINKVGNQVAEIKGGQMVMTDLLSRLLGTENRRPRNDDARRG